MPGSPWWQRGIVYQVYPRSFQDSDGDGVGDLGGIAARLDHLVWLGADAAWISPVFASPMADFGYDVSDYRAIDPLFGTMEDFDALLDAAHARGLKIILDFVPNHTSDQHEWFRESRSSRDNPKRDWYIWADPAPDGGAPNNWLANFGGPAWEFDAASGQYYYHAYLREQPDLNWRNPTVRAAMHDVMRFWLDRGVDGFRVDVIWHLMKDAQLRDNPPNPDFQPGMMEIDRFLQTHSADWPDVHDAVRGMRAVLAEYDGDRVLIGEAYLPLERLVTYYGDALSGAHMPFNFALLETDWTAPALRALIERYEALLPPGAWPNWVLGNHDRPRLASRVGLDQKRVAAMLLLTLRGTPTLYYGDEIGMQNVPVPAHRIQDPWGKTEPQFGRDPVRAPMAWDFSANAGFTTGEPWLPLPPDWRMRNVAAQRADPTSLLSLYRRLIGLRRASPALNAGAYAALPAHPHVLAYMRDAPGQRIAVLLNLTGGETRYILPDGVHGPVLLSTHGAGAAAVADTQVTLRAHEGLIVNIAAAGG